MTDTTEQTHVWCTRVQRVCDGVAHSDTYFLQGRSWGRALAMLIPFLERQPGQITQITPVRVS